MRVTSLVAVVGSVLLALSLGGCSLGQGPLAVRKVLIDVDPAAASAGIDREAIRAIVNDTLGRARGIKLTEGLKSDAAVLRVHIESYATANPHLVQPGGTTLSLGLEVTGAREEGRTDAVYRGHAVASMQGDVPMKALVEQALRDALAQVLSTRGAADLASKDLISWLTDEGATEEQRRRAVRILGTRRVAGAVPALNTILLGADGDLAQQALVAVTNIGDPASVPAVLAYAEGQPPLIRKQAIDAIRAMGTQQGRAWLFTLSTGHPDPEVQRQAAAALAALEGPADAAAAVADNTDAKATPDSATR